MLKQAFHIDCYTEELGPTITSKTPEESNPDAITS